MKIQHYAILWEEDYELEAVQKFNLIHFTHAINIQLINIISLAWITLL